jgi:hypothetical protein
MSRLVTQAVRLCLGLSIINAVAGPVPSLAEALTPGLIQYDFEIKDDQVARACHALLLITNFPKPEAVKFTIIFTFKKGAHAAFVGFAVDVGDMQYQDGKPKGITKIPLASAEFTSKTFDSAGRMYATDMGDGGVGASTNDINDSAAFVSAFASGEFAITFTRQGSPSSRTYVINQPPPIEVLKKFLDCAQTYK